MSNRSATATIAGYVYQFDYAILALLQLVDGADAVEVEQIEDVDVISATDTTAVQCKYYEATEYNHSVIAEPLRYMVAHFHANRASSVRYRLKGHFRTGTSKLLLPLSVDLLKKSFLSYTEQKVSKRLHESLSLSDADLVDFIGRLDIDVNASSLNDQRAQIYALFKREFGCNDFEAEHYYYNNALAKIASLAVRKNPTERRISRGDFLREIDSRRILYNLWYVQFKSRKVFLQGIRAQFFKLSLNTSPYARFFLIDCATRPSDADLKALLLHVQKRWSKLSPRERQPFCPYIYLHNYHPERLAALKAVLRAEGIRSVDGYDFQDATFCAESVCRSPSSESEISLKFVNAVDELGLTINTLKSTVEVYQFYVSAPFFQPSSTFTRNVLIEVQAFEDIQELLQ